MWIKVMSKQKILLVITIPVVIRDKIPILPTLVYDAYSQ